MAITPIQFFSPQAQQAAPVNTLAANLSGTNPTTVNTFSAVLGQVIAALGPLATDTTLTSVGTGNTATGGSGGLSSTVFNLLLLNSLGVGKNTAQSAAVQQLLTTQLLFSATDTADTTGLNNVGTSQLTAALAQQPGANATLLTQLAAASTQPNPIIFSASTLAQAFEIGNGTGSPA
jgi:hypothetical protein